MTGFVEPRPDLVLPNPGGDDDPLGESVIETHLPWLRVFEPREVRVVIGRGQDVEREVMTEHARADGVPIHRRISGGGAVVLAPGMVVVAMRLSSGALDADRYFSAVNAVVIPAIAQLAGIRPACRGHGDLAIATADGERKVLGASLRQTRAWSLYLGVILVADAVPLMERHLRPPSRQPAYRVGRGHAAFCTHFGSVGVTVPTLIAALVDACAGGIVPTESCG